MKLILILTFFCAIQFSLQSKAADQQNPNSPTKTKKVQLLKGAKVIQNAQSTTTAKAAQPSEDSSRCIDDPKNPQLKCSIKIPTKPQKQVQKPKLKPNEYSLSYDANKTTVFATKLHEGLLLSQNCFKKKTPNCLAYTKSLETTNSKPQENMKSPYHNNIGAIHCELMGGKGLIAKTSTNDESDFCQFEDGSMVDSWSAYYKTHQPATQTK